MNDIYTDLYLEDTFLGRFHKREQFREFESQTVAYAFSEADPTQRTDPIELGKLRGEPTSRAYQCAYQYACATFAMESLLPVVKEFDPDLKVVIGTRGIGRIELEARILELGMRYSMFSKFGNRSYISSITIVTEPTLPEKVELDAKALGINILYPSTSFEGVRNELRRQLKFPQQFFQ